MAGQDPPGGVGFATGPTSRCDPSAAGEVWRKHDGRKGPVVRIRPGGLNGIVAARPGVPDTGARRQPRASHGALARECGAPRRRRGARPSPHLERGALPAGSGPALDVGQCPAAAGRPRRRVHRLGAGHAPEDALGRAPDVRAPGPPDGRPARAPLRGCSDSRAEPPAPSERSPCSSVPRRGGGPPPASRGGEPTAPRLRSAARRSLQLDALSAKRVQERTCLLRPAEPDERRRGCAQVHPVPGVVDERRQTFVRPAPRGGG